MSLVDALTLQISRPRMSALRHLLADEAGEEEPVVTFPDDYPNSVRHFLLIGFLGMFIGAIVFFYMGISRKVNTITHVLTFFIAAVAACAYYAMWAGLGVEYKTTDTTPRVIFWARYLDWIVTTPVRCSHHPIWRLLPCLASVLRIPASLCGCRAHLLSHPVPAMRGFSVETQRRCYTVAC